MNKITELFDKYFDFLSQLGGPTFIADLIPNSMVDKTKTSKYNEIAFWKPISSTVSNADILKLELFFGAKLPTSFKVFIQYKHFIELNLGSDSISFFKNLPGTFVEDTITEHNDYFADLIEKSFIPFARISDQGVLCFNTNVSNQTSDYEIISFDLYNFQDSPKKYAPNFLSMFDEFEVHLDEWIKNVNERKKYSE